MSLGWLDPGWPDTQRLLKTSGNEGATIERSYLPPGGPGHVAQGGQPAPSSAGRRELSFGVSCERMATGLGGRADMRSDSGPSFPSGGPLAPLATRTGDDRKKTVGKDTAQDPWSLCAQSGTERRRLAS